MSSGIVRVTRAALTPLASPRLSAAGLTVYGARSNETLERNQLGRALREAEAAIVTQFDVIDGDLLRKLPDLRVIASASSRLDHIDLAAARELGIAVGRTPRAFADSTADLAFGLLLQLARGITSGDTQVRRGFTDAEAFYPGLSLSGRTLAIIGMGHVGRAVARRARGFGMKVVFSSHTSKLELAQRIGAEQHTIAEALQLADVVVVATALTPDTHHLIDAAAISLMKRNAIVINVARGELIDEHALVDALAMGRLAGAGLDVFEREPHIAQGLLALRNVVLSPHRGGATEAAWSAAVEQSCEHIINVLNSRSAEQLTAHRS